MAGTSQLQSLAPSELNTPLLSSTSVIMAPPLAPMGNLQVPTNVQTGFATPTIQPAGTPSPRSHQVTPTFPAATFPSQGFDPFRAASISSSQGTFPAATFPAQPATFPAQPATFPTQPTVYQGSFLGARPSGGLPEGHVRLEGPNEVIYFEGYSDTYFALYGSGLVGHEQLFALHKGGPIKSLTRVPGKPRGYLMAKMRWARDIGAIATAIASGSLQPGQSVPRVEQKRSRSKATTQPSAALNTFYPGQAQTFPGQAQTFPGQAQTFPNQGHVFQPVQAQGFQQVTKPTFTMTAAMTPVPRTLSIAPPVGIAPEVQQQTVSYIVPLPRVGQRVIIDIESTRQSELYTVTSIESPEGTPIDHVKVTRSGNPAQTHDLVVCRGAFQIANAGFKHLVTFE